MNKKISETEKFLKPLIGTLGNEIRIRISEYLKDDEIYMTPKTQQKFLLWIDRINKLNNK